MDIEKLMSVIESILFINGEPIKLNEIAKGLFVSCEQVKLAIQKLIDRYNQNSSGIQIIRLNDSVQMCTNKENDIEISNFFKPVKKANLSDSAIETLSIIAYKQPITRVDIEQIRRVQCSYVLKFLQSHDLVKIVGHKKTVGNPALYGTTDEFLRMLGLQSVEELPDVEQKQQVIENI